MADAELMSMGSASRPGIELRTASTDERDAATAVAALAVDLADDADLYLVFVPDGYDVDAVALALRRWPQDRVIACTSAGALGQHGFDRSSLVAVSLTGPDVVVQTVRIEPLSDPDAAWQRAGTQLKRAVAETDGRASFAILLVDGLSMREEAVAVQVAAHLGGIPLVGGSAGDDLRFARTRVLADGQFAADVATVTIVTTSAPFQRFRLQHHVGGDTILVVTDATPEQRLVHSLNGRSAVHEYAAAVGVEAHEVTPAVYSSRPLVLRAGGADWVRSIAGVEPDGSLRFFSATDPGAILRLATPTPALEAVAAIEATMAELRQDLGEVSGMLVFDCILRRLDHEGRGVDDEVGSLLAGYGAVGFSTFGEQFDGVHVNQTMVGIAFGHPSP